MIGHGGNDTYYVDHAGDKVIEAAGGGADKVFTHSELCACRPARRSSCSSLRTRPAKTALHLNGNEFAQTIQGNAGANVLNGGGGA